MRKVLQIFILLILIFGFSTAGFAQTTLATIEGTLLDEQGNPLPGASITLKNVERGYTHTTMSRSDGRYLISGIQPGKYEIELKISGFATLIRRGMTFVVGAKLTIDFTLKQATLEEEITITAESPMVELSKSEVSSVVSRKFIDDMPLLNRNFENLSIIKAGTQSTAGGYVRSNAQPHGNEEMLIDGISNEQVYLPTLLRSALPADAIQEFRVMTNQFGAEYGNASGMIRSAITRSGTNNLRGRASFFYRDQAFGDANYFIKHDEFEGPERDDFEKPEYSSYRFGGVLGGPIVKDKAHFFIVYEGLRFTQYATITAPLFPREAVPQDTTNNQLFFKLNYQLNEKNNFSFRYSFDHPSSNNQNVGGLLGKDFASDEVFTSHNLQLNWTLYPSDNTMNEMRLYYGYWRWVVEPQRTDLGPAIARPGGYSGTYILSLLDSQEPYYQFIDNFSVYSGDHSLKFGVNLRHVRAKTINEQYRHGYYIFLTDVPFNAANPGTYPYLYYYNLAFPPYTANVTSLGVFAQDSWKIHPRLTLNIGLRYNYYTTPAADFVGWTLKHLNPRFGFSWDPAGDGKTSIRGGIGTYSTNPAADASMVTKVLPSWDWRIIIFPGYPDPFAANPFSPSFAMKFGEEYRNVENQIAPYTLQTTLGVHREVIQDLSLGADLIWAKGYHMLRLDNINPIIPGTYGVHKDPAQGNIYLVNDWGRSDYRGLYLTLNKRYSHGWSVEVAYTLSRSWADVEWEDDSEHSYEEDNWERQYGPTNADARHRISISGIVDLPLGFQLSGLFYYNSALPWNALYLADVNADSLVSDYVDDRKNSRRGYDNFTLNMRLSKYITIDRFRIQIFAEAYNLTNRTNFFNVYPWFDTPNFGNPQQALDPRILQFGARLDF